jgi:aminobenzoyl-glutamate transport protein
MSENEKQMANQDSPIKNDIENTELPAAANGFLGWVERMGNKLPHPFWMFVWICILIIGLSAITSYFGFSATDPGKGELIEVNNLLSGEGLRWFVQNVVTNFAHFAPLGLVLVMLMGVSIAEQSGLLGLAMRKVAFAVPRRIVMPVIFMIGASGNIGSDAGIVIVPPIAAMIFSRMGYHPIAGLIAGYAGATAGFTANFFIAGTDVLMAGITTQVTSSLGPGLEVSATSNWYFMIVSTFMVGLGGAFIVTKYTIPRCNSFAGAGLIDNDISVKDTPLTAEERKGLKNAGIALLLYVALIAVLIVPSWGPLRDPVTGAVVPSPFLRGLIPILFFFFAIPGYYFGKATGTIKEPNDILKHMETGMKGLSGYIVLMLVVAQFIELFSWSNLDKIISISGAEFLQATGLTGPVLFTFFMIIVAFLNLFMGSGSAKWAIFAPVFVPMLIQLNYSPAFVQLMYRVGDSITNCVSPLYIYFPLLIGWIHKYDKRLGIGTIVSLLIPYAVILFVLWVALLFIWYGLNLPIGVGETIYLN